MEKLNLSKYKIPEKTTSKKLERFQERTLEVCKEFGIEGTYRLMLFKYAKKNMNYFEGKISLCYEKFGKEGCSNKARYLISLFRNKKPWEK
jgi:hypothetical protein